MRRLRGDFEGAVDAFAGGYDAYREAARVRLNGLFDASDYPDARDIRGRFTFGVRVLPMPDARDFRVDISDAQAAAIRSDIEAATREALEVAMRDAWSRIVDVCGRMVERLNAYKPAANGTKAEGIFRDSLVENVRDLVSVLPGFNLTGDAFLSDVIGRMERDLCQTSADVLRDSAPARRETAAAAAQILADVSAYLA